MSQDEDLGGTRFFVGFHQRAPEQGRNARHPEGRGADLRNHHGLAGSGAGGEVALEHPERADVPQRGELLPPAEEVVGAGALPDVLRPVPVGEPDDLLSVRQGEGRVGGPLDDLEEAGADQDGEGHGETSDHGEARIAHQHANAEPELHGPAREPRERSRIPLKLLGVLDVAERAPGRVARLFRRHTLRDEVFFEQMQVRVDFPGEIGLGAAPVRGRRKPAEEETNVRHCSQASRRSLSTSPARRRQLSTFAARARSPALVRV